MKRTTLVRLCGVAVFSIGWWVAHTQNPPAGQLTVSKVKDDLYQIVGDGGNVAVYITGEGVILVDDKFEQDHEQIVAKVKSVTSQPIKYILNTHHHADHSGGNVSFEPTVAKYFGRGHTDRDAVIYFPALKTIDAGDLMAGNTPQIDYLGGGSVVEWTKTLDGAMMLDFDTVIPGHGSVTNKAGLMTYRNNVEKLRTRVQGLVRAGKSPEEVGKVMTAEYGWAANSVPMQWSLPGMIAELR